MWLTKLFAGKTVFALLNVGIRRIKPLEEIVRYTDKKKRKTFRIDFS